MGGEGAVRPGTAAAAAPAAQQHPYVDPCPHLVLPCVVPTTGPPAPTPMSAAVANLTGYQAPGHVLQPSSTDGITAGHESHGLHRMPPHQKSNKGGAIKGMMSEGHARGLAASMVVIPCSKDGCRNKGAKECVNRHCER